MLQKKCLVSKEDNLYTCGIAVCYSRPWKKRVFLSSGIRWKEKLKLAIPKIVRCQRNQMEIKLTIAALPEAINGFQKKHSLGENVRILCYLGHFIKQRKTKVIHAQARWQCVFSPFQSCCWQESSNMFRISRVITFVLQNVTLLLNVINNSILGPISQSNRVCKFCLFFTSCNFIDLCTCLNVEITTSSNCWLIH